MQPLATFFPLKQRVTLVFDIGKTTKKALLFDEQFHVLEEITESFSQTTDRDGFPCEDLEQVSAWLTEILQRFSASAQFEITHINFSAYGASLVAIDENKKSIPPFYNYLKPCPQDIKEKFFKKYGTDRLLQETASPWLGFLNSGIQAYWLKHQHPLDFARVKTFLHLPQYFSFMVTGQLYNERTSLGCHTLLWNFARDTYADWVIREQLDQLFPPVTGTSHVVVHSISPNHSMRVGIGVHDSSAALAPYLLTRKDPFLMLSTGTWNICFNPWNDEPLTQHELERDCLCYMTFEGKPVKASRIFLGHEHEVQQKKLAAYFQVHDDEYKQTKFNEQLYRQLQDSPPAHFQPLEMEGSGPLPHKPSRQTDYTKFTSFDEAQHQLMIDLVAWQKLSMDLVDRDEKIKDVIIVGGFSKSPLFLAILKREIATRKFFLSDHPRASALGAAWLVHEGKSISGSGTLLNITSL